MPEFGASSLEKLATAHPDLQRLFKEVVKRWDCKVLEGHRSVERQRRLFSTGASKIDGVKLKGKHNHSPSLAVDVTPYPIEWDNIERHRRFAEYVRGMADSLGIKIRWGGDWDNDLDVNDQKFNDLVHFELVEGEHE